MLNLKNKDLNLILENMSLDNNFHRAELSYENSKTKRTKKKFDEIAEKVDLWSQGSFLKINNKSPRSKRMSFYSRPSQIIVDEDGKLICKKSHYGFGTVKKQAAFFESLVAQENADKTMPGRNMNYIVSVIPDVKQRNILREKVNIVDKVNDIRTEETNVSKKSDILENYESFGGENIHPYYESCDPYENDSSVSSHSSLTSVTESTLSSRVCALEKQLFGDFVEPSNVYRSMSISQDIEDILKLKYNSETESTDVILASSKISRKVRKSLSMSESIPQPCVSSSESEYEVIDSVNFPELDNLNKSLEHCDDILAALRKQGKVAAKDVIKCMEDVQRVLHNPLYHIAGREYTSSCVKLIRSCLVQQSIAERIKSRYDESCFIEGYLEIQNIQLNVKDGFVLINCRELEKSNRGSDLRRLKKLYHVVLMVRNRGDCSIKSSLVYNIIPKSEACRLKLPYGPLEWLEMFEYVRFNNLQPEFKFIFDLYCMETTPKKYNYNDTKFKHAPLRNFLHKCRSVERFDYSASNYPSVFFANIGSFSVSAQGIRPIQQCHQVNMTVPFDSPFYGTVMFSTKFKMYMNDDCQGRLNVYSEIAGKGCWSFYDCELSTTCISGWLNSDNLKPDIIIPLHACLEPAKLCQYTVCAKQNSFSILLDPLIKLPELPFNRRNSTDGNNKKRFLAATESFSESSRWCQNINLTRDALNRWSTELCTYQ